MNNKQLRSTITVKMNNKKPITIFTQHILWFESIFEPYFDITWKDKEVGTKIMLVNQSVITSTYSKERIDNMLFEVNED